MLLKCSWLAIFAILLFRAARWVGLIWMMALWAWRVRRVRCWGFGGSGGRLLRCDEVRGDCGVGGEGWGRCVGGGMYGISSSCCLRCSVRFAQYSCSLHNVIIRDVCSPLSLLYLDRNCQSSTFSPRALGMSRLKLRFHHRIPHLNASFYLPHSLSGLLWRCLSSFVSLPKKRILGLVCSHVRFVCYSASMGQHRYADS